ncbi:MAG: agmatine deiminase family protein [Saprospiraceae bacterium]|nr:agmatine deiminase family protein [Saprospiraceae bacterium]
MKDLVLVSVLFFVAWSLGAQGDPGNSFSVWKAGTDGPSQAFYIDVITDPPEEPARSMAEWEALQAIAVSYDLTGFSEEKKKLVAEIIRHAQQEVDVMVFCYGSLVFNIISRVRNDLQRRGVPLNRVHFIETNFNGRIWIRDYGAHTVYLNDVDSLVLVDWKYEPQYQEADEEVSNAMSSFLNVPLYSTTALPFRLKLDGGNFLTDGNGMAFSSSHVLEDNPLDPSTIDFTVAEFMGIEQYPKLQKLDYDVIHHVDMHMKLIDEETLLVGEYPEGVADGPRIEENINWFVENVKTVFGTDYRVERILMPPDEYGNYPDSLNNCSAHPGYGCYYTYTNALFINKLVLVPTYFDGGYYDSLALVRWQEIMPGYDIVGIDCREIIREYGAIHCVTKEIGENKPIRIIHQKRLTGCADATYQEVRVKVQHASGIEKVKVFFRTHENPVYRSLEMDDLGDGNYLGNLPNTMFGDTISYYFEATANDGKTFTRPYPGPEGPYQLAINCMTTGLAEKSLEDAVRIYPNPGNEIFIEITNPDWKNASWTLQGINGIIQKQGMLQHSHQQIITKGEIPAGLYFLVLEKEGRRGVFKVVFGL